ncbi:MAG: ABC transporter substrate-binding protein, partial [Anaerolineae bacterium]|nr:ABC transporter substrate-binding protein [Anaerolineae bacterium]
LVPDDTNACGVSGEYTDGHCPDVFVHDREAETTERVSLDGNGNQVDGESGYDSRPSISDDGRYVAFNQFDPVTARGGQADRVYVRDREAGTTTLVSVDNPGWPLDGNSFDPSISADGRRIAFVSQDAPTVDGAKVECQSVSHSCVYAYIRDVATGGTVLASVESDGQRILGDYSYDLSLSADGSNVTFSLIRSDGEAAGIFLHNLSTLNTVQITGVRSWQPAISSGGEYVAFATDESLVADDTNAVGDIYIVPSVPGDTASPVVPVVDSPESVLGEPSIAYIGADNNVWLINTDGTDAKKLTTDADPAGNVGANVYSGPAWSPDGRMLYVTYGTQNTGAIYRIDLQSGELEPVGPQDRLVRAVTASPDGEHLGYVYDVPAVCPFDYGPCLALLDLKSGTSEILACMECGAYTQPGFSPDAGGIALVAVGYEWSALGLFRFGTPEVTFPDVGGECRNPKYSPETGRLWAVCTSQPFWEERTWSLYTLDIQTGERTEIMQWDPSIRPSDMDLSPDSTQLTFELDGMIDILDLATMESRTLIEGRQPAWRPLGTTGSRTVPPDAAPNASGPIKVAILAPLMGGGGAFGQPMRDGALMAVDEWNAKGGINGTAIEVVIEDSRCMVDVAAAATNKVIDEDGVRFIIGEVCASAAISIAEIAMAKNALLISPAVTPPSVTVAAGGTIRPTVFSAGTARALQGTVAARFAEDRLRARTAAVFVNQDSDSTCAVAEAFIAGFEAAGGRVIVNEMYFRNTQDFSAMLAKVKDAEPDVLYLPGYTSEVNGIAAQAKTQRIEAVLLGGGDWNSSDLDVRLVEGGYFTVDFSPKDPRPSVQAFISQYQAKYGSQPNTSAISGYNAAQILFQSMALAGSTTDVAKVAQAMASGTFAVVTGDATYDARHNLMKPLVLLGIKDGQVVYVDTVAP